MTTVTTTSQQQQHHHPPTAALTANNLALLNNGHNEPSTRPRSGSNASKASDDSSDSLSGARLTDDQVLAALDALFFEKQSNEAVVARATLSRLEKSKSAAQSKAKAAAAASVGDEDGESNATNNNNNNNNNNVPSTSSLILPLLTEYERTIGVVNARLAERVMKNYNLFVQGMTKIHEMGQDLHQSAVICKNGRRLVQQTKGALTTHGIIVVAKHRKRQLYASICADLAEVQAILANERLLRQALEEGDFPKAIELCLACRESLRAYEQFTCLASFGTYVQSSWELLQRRLENAVRDVVRSYDALAYERVLIAHRRMGRGFHVLERLQRQFIDTINDQAKNALYAHVLQSERNAERAEQLKMMRFKELADALADQHFVACLHTILDYLTALLITHHRMTTWHARYVERQRERERELQAQQLARQQRRETLGDDFDDEPTNDSSSTDKQHNTSSSSSSSSYMAANAVNGSDGDSAFLNAVCTSLVRFRKTMWDKMQRKVNRIFLFFFCFYEFEYV